MSLIKTKPFKSYSQFCSIAAALDLLGGRWTLLLLRDLLPGPRRYSDLAAANPGLTSNLLAQRLKELEAAGLIAKSPQPHNVTAYALTERGQMAEPILRELARFGAVDLTLPPKSKTRTDPRWLAQNILHRYGGGLPDAVLTLTIDDQPFTLIFSAGTLSLRDGPADAPRASISGPSSAIAHWLIGKADFDALIAAQRLTLSGDEGIAIDLATLLD